MKKSVFHESLKNYMYMNEFTYIVGNFLWWLLEVYTGDNCSFRRWKNI